MFNGRTKGVNLSTICLFAQFFGMSLKEFFDDPIFDQENLEVKKSPSGDFLLGTQEQHERSECFLIFPAYL